MPGNLNGSLYGFPADTEFDALLLAAVQAPEDEAGAAWQAVQRYDVEQGLYQIQIVTARYVEAIADSVSGYAASSLGGRTTSSRPGGGPREVAGTAAPG